MRSHLFRLVPYVLQTNRSRFRLVVYLLALVAAAAASAIVPLLFRRVVDDGLAEGRSTVAAAWTVAALLGSIVAAAGVAVSGWLGAAVGQELIYRLRVDLYRHMSSQPVGFFAQSRAGALASRISGDALDVQGLIQGLLGTVAGQGLTLVLAAGAMIFLDPIAFVVALAAAPLFLLPIRPFGRRLRRAGNEQAEARALMQHYLTEQLNVEGAVAREVFDAHDRDAGQFDAAAVKLRNAVISRNANFYASSFFLSALGGFGVASVYGVASIGAGRDISIGTVIALAGLVGLMYKPLTQMATQGIGLAPSLVALERVYEVLDHGRSAGLGSGTVGRPVQRLSLDRVWFRHPGPEATLPSLRSADTPPGTPEWTIRDVSLDLRPGTTALVGLTGSGKTTTALLASGIYGPTRGQVTLDGIDLDQLDPAARRAAIGVLSQDPFVIHASVRENLQFAAPDADDAQLMAALDQSQLLETITAMPDGLATVIGDRGYRLSGGERQRLALARVLLKRPDVVIMDEATAHLDAKTEQAVTTALDQLARHTIRLVIAHRLSTVRSADQIVVMDSGQIIESGTHEQLVIQDGTYSKLVRAAAGDELPGLSVPSDVADSAPPKPHGAIPTGPAHALAPEVIASSEPGSVIFLNGTTCSGKTTTAEALQAVLDGVWIRMGIDDFNLKLREAMADRRPALETLADHQRPVLGFHRAVAGYVSAGNSVIVDHVLGEDWRLDDCLRVFSDVRVTFVGVHCPLPELERREAERSSRRAGSAARQFPLVHAHGLYDVEIDTAEMSPKACAEHISSHLVTGSGTSAFDHLRAARVA